MAFLMTKCPECGTDGAIFDDGSYIPCKCGSVPYPANDKHEFKRPQLMEDIANDK